MKIEISVDHIVKLSELAESCYSLFVQDRDVNNHLYGKSEEFSSILEFLENPESYIGIWEMYLRGVEADMKTP